MIRINLLPVRAKIRKENVRQLISIYLLSVLVVVGVIAYVWLAQTYKISRLEGHLQRVKAEVASYAKFEQILKDLQAKKVTIEKKRETIIALQQDRDNLVRILAVMSVQIPAERVWFEKMSQAGPAITLDGVALSDETIVEFMRNLESSPYVDKGSVNLVHTKLTSISGMKLREFRMSCSISGYSVVQQRLKPPKSS
jgi:type IV pilus assembly protein PilN